ncbi:ABC transporter substrate-binding protein [Hoyosella rhizosphaerae]|uniref:Sn-glycerol-3-phosphate ABC transporter substrate-binding lipoprotein UgpB n=1 Tax=Hoyosella rhizosphaerae TaxID=1755582 RepID=A0A916UGG8_9ACTN|nr:ABC transporter substrate-binding protein [Hoyosella rhizosphaerae]MBN4928152.1 ABC transporter substrate-binding protein [Hoyosella rhizosphaerae]GGC72826.1 sn-glycerol-3-phosphate ABC transporter substrate-binding lipoprotein UgpB [Hoyosella rhizosphaerae]
MTGLNRRHFLGLAGTAAAAAALTACAGTGGGSSAGGSANRITFWSNHPGTSRDVELELIRRFEQANPDITVQLISSGKNYEEVAQKFNAALTGGDLPDVVVLSDVWWFNYALNETIEPLDSHFSAAGVDANDYVDSLLADYLFDGNHFALPYARSTPLFYYNKDLWQTVGLPDRGPDSWAEFGEWAPELQQAIGGGKFAHSWANANEYLAWMFQGPNWTFGGSYSDEWDLKLTDDRTIEAANWLRDQVHSARYANVSADHVNDFAAGLSGSIIASTGDLSTISATSTTFDFGTAFLPRTSEPGCPTGGAGLAIPSRISDERKENALRFIEFITNAENTAYFAQNVGYMPVRKSAVETAEYAQFLRDNPNSRTAVDQLAFTGPQDYARVFVPGADRILGTGFERIALQNAEVEPTFADVQNQLQQIIDRQITPKLPR